MNLTKIAQGLRLIADGLEDASAGGDKAPDKAPAKSAGKKTPPKQDKAPAKTKPADDDFGGEPDAVSKEDVIQALQGVMKKHGRAALDEILGDFNVTSVGNLDPKDYADVVTNAKAKVDEG